jgi:lipopolysaccharide transport protein LptA
VVALSSGGVPLPMEEEKVVKASIGGATGEAGSELAGEAGDAVAPDPADEPVPAEDPTPKPAARLRQPPPVRLAQPPAPDEMAPKPPTKAGAAYSVPKAAGDLVIAANSQTDFQVKDKRIVFAGGVIMKNERFYLTADRLVAYMKENDQGIEFAEAQGNVVVRMVEDGQETGSSGLSNRAVFYPHTGEIVLRGWPQVRFGNKAHVASSATTEMSLFTDGRMKTSGRNQTMIVP